MKKQLLMILMTVTALTTAAQSNRSTLEILTSYKWTTDAYEEDGVTMYSKVFTSTTYKTTVTYTDGFSTEYSYQYYLSNGYETSFDSSKLGKITYGNHIMAKQIDTGKIYCMRILTLDDEELYTIPVLKPGENRVGYGAQRLVAKPK